MSDAQNDDDDSGDVQSPEPSEPPGYGLDEDSVLQHFDEPVSLN